MTGQIDRVGTVAWLSFRGSLQGARLVGLVALALLPSFIVGAVAASHPDPQALSNVAEALFGLLTLPIVAMVIVLVLSVAQFRTEIDAETLVYLSDRSISRASLVLGKYLGSLGAALVLLVPAGLLPLAIARFGGGTPFPSAVIPAIAAGATLACVAYGGFFLFLGLTMRSALVIGLLFGFLWEELLPLLPGVAPKLTVIFYLRSFLSGVLPTGPLSGYPSAVSIPVSLAVLVGLAGAFLVLGSIAFRSLETAPEKESA